MSKHVLDLVEVTKHFPVHSFRKFGEVVHAMDRISFELYKGEILALVGESGSGKTTTASVIARLYPPTSGVIKIDEQKIAERMTRKELLRYRKQVQMIFQDPFGALNPTQTIEHILTRPFIIHRMIGNKRQLTERLDGLLCSVGLEPPKQFLTKFPHELSGGQRQRVNIARTFSVNPEIVLADEPTSMLDVSIRMSIMNMMLALQESMKVSYLYITHDLAGARYMANRIAVMYAGMIMEIGPSDEIIQNSYHPYTQLLKSAAPSPEEGLGRKRLTTKGDIPSLIHPPNGCRFHPRCPFAQDICSTTILPMKRVNPNHYGRCIL